jgi:hypothetical protein
MIHLSYNLPFAAADSIGIDSFVDSSIFVLMKSFEDSE